MVGQIQVKQLTPERKDVSCSNELPPPSINTLGHNERHERENTEHLEEKFIGKEDHL
jgi:hypothetical protein